MNQGFYKFANFFLGLTLAMVVFNRIAQFLLGKDFYTLSSFSNWYLTVNIVSLAGTLFLLRYYYRQQYWVAFWTAIIATTASLCFTLLVYMLSLVHPELYNLYLPILLIALSTGILHAASLVFSKSGRKLWLRWAGIVSGISNVMILTVSLYLVNVGNLLLTGSPEKLNNWASWIGSFIYILFILNFLDESKLAKSENVRTDQGWDGWMGLAGILSLGFALYFGGNIAAQSYDMTHVPGKAKILAMPFDARLYVSPTGDTLMYRFMKPLAYNSQKKYPLVVCLPYTCAEDNIRQITGCPPAQWLSQSENRNKYPAFLFVPRCPRGTGWGGVSNTPSIEKLTLEAIDSLVKEPGIDRKRIYVTGISRGGYGSWHFIGTRPDLFAAAVPICGADEPALGKRMISVAIWAFHGAQDRNVPVAGSRDLIAAIRHSGGHPRYTEFPNLEHSIWEEVKATPGLLDWLFAQKQE